MKDEAFWDSAPLLQQKGRLVDIVRSPRGSDPQGMPSLTLRAGSSRPCAPLHSWCAPRSAPTEVMSALERSRQWELAIRFFEEIVGWRVEAPNRE